MSPSENKVIIIITIYYYYYYMMWSQTEKVYVYPMLCAIYVNDFMYIYIK